VHLNTNNKKPCFYIQNKKRKPSALEHKHTKMKNRDTFLSEQNLHSIQKQRKIEFENLKKTQKRSLEFLANPSKIPSLSPCPPVTSIVKLLPYDKKTRAKQYCESIAK